MAPTYTIALGCQPGSPRPGDLLPGVLEGTGVTIDPTNTILRFFGDWEWAVPEDQTQTYERARETIQQRIKALYESGLVRWGSW